MRLRSGEKRGEKAMPLSGVGKRLRPAVPTLSK